MLEAVRVEAVRTAVGDAGPPTRAAIGQRIGVRIAPGSNAASVQRRGDRRRVRHRSASTPTKSALASACAQPVRGERTGGDGELAGVVEHRAASARRPRRRIRSSRRHRLGLDL